MSCGDSYLTLQQNLNREDSRFPPRILEVLSMLGVFSPSLGPVRHLNTSSGQACEHGRELM